MPFPLSFFVWFGGVYIVAGLLLVVNSLRATPPQHMPVHLRWIGYLLFIIGIVSTGASVALFGDVLLPLLRGHPLRQELFIRFFLLLCFGSAAYFGGGLVALKAKQVMDSRQRQLTQGEPPHEA